MTSAEDLRKFTAGELAKKLDEAKEEAFNLRFQLATNQLDDTAQVRLVRREIARISTVMREQELDAWRDQQEEDA